MKSTMLQYDKSVEQEQVIDSMMLADAQQALRKLNKGKAKRHNLKDL